MYDDDAAAHAWDLVKNLSFTQRLDFWAACGRDGLNAARPNGRGSVADLAKDLVAIAEEGLRRLHDQGLGDEDDIRFLAPLKHILTDGRTRADRILAGEVPF